MSIVKWAPFSAFASLERELQSMLDRHSGLPATMGWRPVCDIYHSNGDLVVNVELPGVEPADVAVEFDEGMLRITGEKIEEIQVDDDKDRFVRERRYGSFRRDLVLPEGVHATEIKARFDNGVLTVTVPVPSLLAQEDRPEPIKIDVTTPKKLQT